MTENAISAGRGGRDGFRMPRPLILDRYIFREFMLSFVAVMSFVALLMLVASIFDKFGDILQNDTPLGMAALYFAYSLPFKVMQAVPIAAMLAVLFSLGSLARNNEILAFMTSGIHSLRIAAPVVFGGVLVFFGSVLMNEFVVPPLQVKAKYLERRYIEGKEESKITTERNVFERGRGNRFYLMRRYFAVEKRMELPQIVDLTPDYSGIRGRIEAQSAQFVSNDPEGKKSEWVFTGIRKWAFDETGHLTSFVERAGPVTVYLEEDLTTILGRQKEPEEMNFPELRQHIQILAQRNQPTYGFITDLVMKITFPMGILVIMIIGFSYGVRTRAGTVVTAFGYGILWAIGYYAVTAVLRALGHSGNISPYIAGVFPILAFAFIAAHYLRKSYRWYS